jgi:apolipoprotein N-acyltransferase
MGRLLALVLGGLPVVTFPEPSWWWFAFACLVPLLAVIRGSATVREAALRGWLGGVGFILAVHHWLLPNLLIFLPLVAAVVGLLWIPWGVAAWQLLRPPVTAPRAAAALVVLPCAWLTVEAVRSWAALGGPWGLLGASQWQVDQTRALAALGGVWLVSFCVVVVNAGLALLVFPGVARPARLVAAVTVVALSASTLSWWAFRPEPPTRGAARVALVQPGLVRGPDPRFDRGEVLTRQLAGQRLDLVVWAESSVGFDPASRADVTRRLAALSRMVGAPLLVNVDARQPGVHVDQRGIRKTALLVGPDGPLASYDKNRMVPFGEYIPLRPVFWWAARFRAAAEDRVRGDRLAVMDAGGVEVGPLVCFESAFPDMSRRLVAEGADLIAYQSSTPTFQESWAPEQHASLAALRAAETGRPVVHATLTGVSTAYDGTGRRVAGPLGTSQSGVLVAELPLTGGRTGYRSIGEFIPTLAVWVMVVAAAASAGRRRAKVEAGASAFTEMGRNR